jgi:hypothetical protein
MAVHVDSILLLPQYPDRIFIQWDVSNPAIGANYLFWLYLSDNPKSDFQPINTIPILNEFCYTVEQPLLFKQEYIYIRINVEVQGVSSTSEATTLTRKLSLWSLHNAMEIIRRKDLLREEFVGVPCEVRKRRILGEVCQECVDPITGLQIKTHCHNCFDTKVVGGFSDPIEVHCEIVEGERNIVPSEGGTIENLLSQGKLTWPLMFKGDVIIEKERNRRWYVNTVRRQMLRTFPIDQTMDIRQIAPKDVEYSL